MCASHRRERQRAGSVKWGTRVISSICLPVCLSVCRPVCPFIYLQLGPMSSTFHYITRNRSEGFSHREPTIQAFPLCVTQALGSNFVPFILYLFGQPNHVCGMCTHTHSHGHTLRKHVHFTCTRQQCIITPPPRGFEWQCWVGTLNQMLFNPEMTKPANHICRHTDAHMQNTNAHIHTLTK